MKPEAPAELRGEFKPIPTAVPGVQVCEHLPMLAARMGRWALVRSLSHREFNHLPATHRLLTGAPMPLQRGSDLDNVLSRRDWPCYAAGLNYLRPRRGGVPAGVTLPHALIEGPLTWPGQHAGLLGPAHDPLLVTQDPNSPSFRLDALTPAEGTDPGRAARRRELLGRLDAAAEGGPFREQQRQAFELLTSGAVASAFRLEREPDRTRERYGRTPFGQSLLLAKRLVRAGVPIVQANMGIVQTWDTHVDNWGRLKRQLLPWLDRALAALVDDLEAEGLLGEVLVAALGEFGRSPKVNAAAGRDHWTYCYSVVFAGAGVRGGTVCGASDAQAAFVKDRPVRPADICATVYHCLGIDPDLPILDKAGRPVPIAHGGEPVREILA
jgi:hypothetical protein